MVQGRRWLTGPQDEDDLPPIGTRVLVIGNTTEETVSLLGEGEYVGLVRPPVMDKVLKILGADGVESDLRISTEESKTTEIRLDSGISVYGYEAVWGLVEDVIEWCGNRTVRTLTPDGVKAYKMLCEEGMLAQAEFHVGEPGWVKMHLFEDPPVSEESKKWIRSRPASVQKLMCRFPPGCVVKTKEHVSLGVPIKGTYGIVMSYYEEGYLGVRQGLTGSFVAQCSPDDLELVNCRSKLQVRDVLTILGKLN